MHTATSVTDEHEARAIRSVLNGIYQEAFIIGTMSMELADLRNELARTKERLAAAEYRLKMQPVLD